jgi:hypothetical protein
MGQLDDEGCVVTFSDKNWKVTKSALVVEKGVKLSTLCLCTGQNFPSTLVFAKKNKFSRTVVVAEQVEK